jgi:PPM family protein phosphatase
MPREAGLVTDDDRTVLRYAVASNAGTLNDEFNKQAAYAGPHLLLIADGMRHLSSPYSPSALAVEQFRRLDVRMDPGVLSASLERGIERLREIFTKSLADNPRSEGTGVLLTAMARQGSHAAIAHIGSTRAYRLRDGELTQLTRDHTIGQSLVEAGKIRPDEMGSDRRFVLPLRWLDGQLGEPADISTHEVAGGDRYVLCTDGISRVMSSGILQDILRQTASDPQDIADEIAGRAFPVEEHGQLTCVVADVVEPSR